ncbi:DUF6478 family protein [uncultured Roseobacter sp.]|uniref:DUF6478 family protein n=1 Tax=uncultured Roseobacter sp. TaxID=114847 RepID=UPI0026220FAA|nr:DUF6478 family protein [uncultured Roseobacter sp.]
MGKGGDTFLDAAINRRMLQRWAMSARAAGTARLSVLSRQSDRARALRAHLDQLIHTADERLALADTGDGVFPRPHNADWAWRPELWRGALRVKGVSSVQSKTKLGSELTLFHDCPFAEMTLRQVRNQGDAGLAPCGLGLDVFRFGGSFLSLVLDLPPEGLRGLSRNHVLAVSATTEMERPLEIFVRLNIRHGPNTEQLVRELPSGTSGGIAEFDLAGISMNEKRVEKVWVDLIFEEPGMNEVILRDLTITRRPRAQM